MHLLYQLKQGDKMDFSEIVKVVRKELGMSQEELAHNLKISFSTVNRWENGKTHPNKMALSVFSDFCKKRGVNLRAIMDKNEGKQ